MRKEQREYWEIADVFTSTCQGGRDYFRELSFVEECAPILRHHMRGEFVKRSADRSVCLHTESPHRRHLCRQIKSTKRNRRDPFSHSLSLRHDKNVFRLYLCCNVSNCIFVPIKVCIFPIFLRFLSSKAQKLYSTQVRCWDKHFVYLPCFLKYPGITVLFILQSPYTRDF